MSTEVEVINSVPEQGEPTQEIAPRPIKMQELSPEYAEIMVLGTVLQKSGYFKDVRDQAQAVTKILFGRELGFSPIISMSGIHIIEGKPALSSNLMATLIKRSGKYDYRVKHRYPHPKSEPCSQTDCFMWNNKECVLMFLEKLAGAWEMVGESSFTITDAETAKIPFKTSNGHATSWAKYPKAMLFARALSQGLRTYCPDVSAAPIYNPEEMGAEVNEEGEVTDLPKKAKQVERTTEDIPITRSAPGPAVLPVSAAESAEQGGAEIKGPASPEIPGSDCIGSGEAANFHRMFKDALPAKLRKDADALVHDWLRQQGIVDVLGKPSALAIKKESFYDVRNLAVEFAGSFRI